MPVVAFDTHEFVKTLSQSGMPEAQAEAISKAVREAHQSADLATRTDMCEMETALRGDLEKAETALRGEIKDLRKDMDSRFVQIEGRFIQLEQRMTIKLGSMLVVAIGVFAAIVKLV